MSKHYTDEISSRNFFTTSDRVHLIVFELERNNGLCVGLINRHIQIYIEEPINWGDKVVIEQSAVFCAQCET